MSSIIQYVLYLVFLVVLAVPLGKYIAHVMDGKKTFLTPVLGGAENATYKLLHVDPNEQMGWKRYCAAVFLFSGFGLVLLFLLQVFQNVLPLNPQQLPGVNWDLAFNTAVSFVTNTNWQAYSGETTLSYLSQFLGLTVQNFVTPATGLAVLYALIRGIRQQKAEGLGSFWVDMVRSCYYILLPLNLVIAILLAGQGVVQNLIPGQAVDLVEPVAYVNVADPSDTDVSADEAAAISINADGTQASWKAADGSTKTADVSDDGTFEYTAADGTTAELAVTQTVLDGVSIDSASNKATWTDDSGSEHTATVSDGGFSYVDADGNTQAATVVTKQFAPQGPAASQIAIKQTGTNGGGYFGVNSAHPYENPTVFSNLLEMTGILLIPVALCFSFGISVANKKQGVAIFAAMFILLVAALTIIGANEQAATSELSDGGQVAITVTDGQPGGNMEGKEARFGVATSSTWAAYTTAASNGSVNSMHDSYTPFGGMIQMLQMGIGEVVFGGVGCGLYGMLGFVFFTVFIAGLMVGRTPEFLGKKIGPYEMKWAVVICLATPFVILVGSGIATLVPEVADSLNNSGAHGLSEVLYAYTSAGGNNGSAFAGFNANTVFLNVSLAIVMLGARFLPIPAALAIAGSLSRKQKVATTAGTLSTTNAMFVFLLILIVLLVGALSFFPAYSLGPIAEFFQSIA